MRAPRLVVPASAMVTHSAVMAAHMTAMMTGRDRRAAVDSHRVCSKSVLGDTRKARCLILDDNSAAAPIISAIYASADAASILAGRESGPVRRAI